MKYMKKLQTRLLVLSVLALAVAYVLGWIQNGPRG
jgi:hypothetical protein